MYHANINDISHVSMTDKCVVLDLDQTLIATQNYISSLIDLDILSNPNLIDLRNRTYHIEIEDIEKPGVGTKYDYWGVVRPHVMEFLIFCFSYFKIVAVWTAGQRPYGEAIVDYLFKDLPKPHVLFTHDDIETDTNGYISKPLTKMIESNPVLRRNMSLQNTLAIDDNALTFRHNLDNGVLIPAYEPVLNINALGRDDPSLLQLKYWLLQPEVVDARDVAVLDKSKIFTTSIDAYKSKLQHGYNFK